MSSTILQDSVIGPQKKIEEFKLRTPDASDQQSELLERLPSHPKVSLGSPQAPWE